MTKARAAERREYLLRRLEEGATQSDIARETGVSRQRISQDVALLQRRGLVPPKLRMGRAKRDDPRIARLLSAKAAYGLNVLDEAMALAGRRHGARALCRLEHHTPNRRTLDSLCDALDTIERDGLIWKVIAPSLGKCEVCRSWFYGASSRKRTCGPECSDLRNSAWRWYYDESLRRRQKTFIAKSMVAGDREGSQRAWAERYLAGESAVREQHGPVTKAQVARMIRIAELRGEPPHPALVRALERMALAGSLDPPVALGDD